MKRRNYFALYFLFIFLGIHTTPFAKGIIDNAKYNRILKLRINKTEIDSLSSIIDGGSTPDLIEKLAGYSKDADTLSMYLENYLIEIKRLENLIEQKRSDLEKLNLEDEVFSISGFVESREKDCAVINFGNGRIALKSGIKTGSKFSGNIKRYHGSIPYYSPGGYLIELDMYVPTSSISIEERREKINNELDKYLGESKTLLSRLLTKSSNFIARELKRETEKLLISLYASAENYYVNLDYKNALSDFTNVYEINKDYFDTKDKIILCQKNIQYQKALELEKMGSFSDSYKIFFQLSVPEIFLDSKGRFIASFEKFCINQLNHIKTQRNIDEFITLMDTIHYYMKEFPNESVFKSLQSEYLRDFTKTSKDYYNAVKENSKPVLIPEGDFIKDFSFERVKHEGILLYPNLVTNDLVRCFRIIKGSGKINNDNRTGKSIVTREELKEISNWLDLNTLDYDDISYIKAGGWLNEKERNAYSAKSNFNYNYSYSDNLLMRKISDIKEPSKREYYFKESKNERRRIDNNISNDKDYAIEIGKITASHYFTLIPTIGASWNFNNWHPINLPEKNMKIADNIFSFEGGIFLGYNFSPNYINRSESFGGIGVSVNYFHSFSYDCKKVISEPAKVIGHSDFNISGNEFELVYRDRIVLGAGYSTVYYKYSYKNISETGRRQILEYNQESIYSIPITDMRLNAYFLRLGLDFHYISLYTKTYFSNKRDGLFSWDNKNLTGNFIFGVNINIPIMLLLNEPILY